MPMASPCETQPVGELQPHECLFYRNRLREARYAAFADAEGFGAICFALEALGLGVEVMSSPAACRTYNVLLSEGRRVALALIPV